MLTDPPEPEPELRAYRSSQTGRPDFDSPPLDRRPPDFMRVLTVAQAGEIAR